MPTTTYDQAAELLAAWGAEPVMNPLEAVMWRAEADPRLRSPILSIELLDQVPDWDRLVAAHEWGTLAVPRARQKVVEPSLGFGAPVWVDDPDFDLAYHLRRVSLTGGSMRELLELAQTMAMTPFDRARPPWEAVLVEGLDGGQAAYVTKMHHSSTDGLGGMQLVSLLRSRTPDHTPEKPVATFERPPAPNPAKLAAEQAQQAIRGVPTQLARRLANAGDLARELVTNPANPLGDAVRYVSSLQRIIGQSPAEPSPLLSGRSMAWRFAATDLALSDLRAAAKAAEGSVNDAYIAAVLGAFRLYHEHFGESREELPIAFPISLRRGDDPMGGNRFAGARLAGPMGVADPRERIQLIHNLVLNVRGEPAVAALDSLSSVLAFLPTPLLTRIMVSLGKGHDVQASNVPGVAHPVYLAGARVTRLYPFGPLPGCAAMIGMVSHDGTCCVGANVDAAAVTDTDTFADCLREGFAEVLSLARRRPARRR